MATWTLKLPALPNITSIQVDIKVDGLTTKSSEAFEMTRKDVYRFWASMIPCISEPAPNYHRLLYSNSDSSYKISEVIGKGGKTINKIIDETGAQMTLKMTAFCLQ